MYIGPRKDFFADLDGTSRASARSGGTPGSRATAAIKPMQPGRYLSLGAPRSQTWQQRGYDARTFCSNPRICGWNYIHTACKLLRPGAARQGYHVFAQYEHIAMGHPLLAKMSLIIGDELPIRAFLHPWHIPAAAIVPPDLEPGPIADLVQRLRTLSLVPKVTWSGPELLDALGGAEAVLSASQSFRDSLSFAAYEPELRAADGVDDVPFFHIPYLMHLLRREAERAQAGKAWISRARVDSTGLTLLLRRAPRALPSHVIWLDATANSALYETLFRRPVEVVRPEVALTGRVRQVWAGLNNKMGLSTEGVRDGAKIDHVRRQIARILSRGYTKPGLHQLQGSRARTAAVGPGTPSDDAGTLSAAVAARTACRTAIV
jgi:hypothetical protein